MERTRRSYHNLAPDELYSEFLNALAGLEDDAIAEGYSPLGLEYLRKALQAFSEELRVLHGSGAL